MYSLTKQVPGQVHSLLIPLSWLALTFMYRYVDVSKYQVYFSSSWVLSLPFMDGFMGNLKYLTTPTDSHPTLHLVQHMYVPGLSINVRQSLHIYSTTASQLDDISTSLLEVKRERVFGAFLLLLQMEATRWRRQKHQKKKKKTVEERDRDFTNDTDDMAASWQNPVGEEGDENVKKKKEIPT